MNEALTVQIRNPHAVRQALQVALEVSWHDLPERQVSVLRRLMAQIPSQTAPADLRLSEGEAKALLNCSGYFRNTATRACLREELWLAFTELMIPLQKGARP